MTGLTGHLLWCPMVGGVRIHNAAPTDFDWVLRYLSESPIHFSSTRSALSALSASHKFLCSGLSTLASDYLARRLSLSNVLMVLQELTLHCPREQGSIPVCASPKRAYNNLNDIPESVNLVEKDNLGKKFKCCESLHANCLNFVDKHASALLASELMLNVDLSVLKVMVCRSSLHIKSEMEVFSALTSWSKSECKRLHLPDLPESYRAVVSGCQYMIRYLTMTPDDFREGPMISGMLTEEESDALLYTLLKPGALLPDHLLVLRRSMMEQRGLDENLITKAEEKDPNKIDLQISKLQELKEKELAYKNNYSLFDEMFLCLRCLLD